MRATLLTLALVCLAAPAIATDLPDGRVVELNELNFDAGVAKGPTLVEVYADWCSHCKQLAPIWTALAKELEGEIYVTKVNGPKNRALVKRLNVNAYPAILYLRDGQMREYKEARSVARLAAFGRKAWRDVKPVPFYRAPNNWFGRVGGLLSRVPGIAEEGYTSLKHTHGLGDVSILFLVLMVPVTLGVLCIVAADACVVRAARAESAARRRRAAGSAAAGSAAAAAGGGGSGAPPPPPPPPPYHHPHQE